MTVSVCPVCGESAAGIEFVCTDFTVSGESFPVMHCSGCGFRMTSPAPGPESIGKYYQSEDYVSHSNSRQGLVNRLYHTVRRYMLGRKYRMVSRDSGMKTGKILDIGAGTGYFLKMMQDNNWKITGIEVSDQARKFASDHLGIKLLPGNPDSLIQIDSFDVITLWHVLEHLHNPGSYLESLKKLINPGGTLLIALPNPSSFDAGYYKQFWAAWDVPRHLWHFNPEHIVRFAENYGFKLRKIRRLPFDAFYVSILSEKYRKTTLSMLRGMVIGSVSWLISLFRKRKCSSLVYVFKK